MTIEPSKRFALFAPPISDPRFAAILEHLYDTVAQASNRLRTRCAIENGISYFDTEVTITPDADRPNFVTITARPAAVKL